MKIRGYGNTKERRMQFFKKFVFMCKRFVGIRSFGDDMGNKRSKKAI